MRLTKGAFVGEENFERYQNARYNNKNSFYEKFKEVNLTNTERSFLFIRIKQIFPRFVAYKILPSG